MTINLDNYEEFFAAFIDKELTKEEQNKLFKFLEKHPELKQEFEDFKLTVLMPDEKIGFPEMNSLFKNSITENEISDELLVAYLDDELEGEEKEKIANAIAQNARIKRQFEELKSASLVPDLTIVFPNKESLYRTEKKKRIIYLDVWKYAAAAVLTGFMVWTFYPSNIDQVNKNQTVSEIKNNPLNTPIPQISTPISVPEKNDRPVKESVASTGSSMQMNNTKMVVSNKTESIETKSHTSTENLKEVKMISSSIPSKTNFDAITAESREPVESFKFEKEQSKFFIAANTAPSIETKTPLMEPVYAKNEMIENEKAPSEFYIMNTPADDIKRTKVGGFLKKVKRIIERTNPISQLFSNDDEVELRQKM